MKRLLISLVIFSIFSATFGGSQVKKVFESELLGLDAREWRVFLKETYPIWDRIQG